MTNIVWNFPDVSTHILLWMFIGMLLYLINICLLLGVYNKARMNTGCCNCNGILSIFFLLFILINMLTLIFMASNNGIEPIDFSNFDFSHDNNYTMNEKLYFILYIISFNTFNIYCLIIVSIGIVNGLDAIKTVKYSSAFKIFGILTIIIDIAVRITCILFYCTPLINEKVIFISLYTLLMIIYLLFIVFIFILRVSARGETISNFNDDYLYSNGLSHLNLLHLIFIIWYIGYILYSVFAVFMSNKSSLYNTSLWIELLFSFILNIIVLYYLLPSNSGGNITDNVTKKKNRRFRAESLSKGLPVNLRKGSNSYRTGNGMYWNIHDQSLSGRQTSINKESSYNKGGYVHAKEIERSWYDKKDNVYGTPESAINVPEKETTPAYMKQGVYDVPKYNKNKTDNKKKVINVQSKSKDVQSKSKDVQSKSKDVQSKSKDVKSKPK
eukprot:78597_1